MGFNEQQRKSLSAKLRRRFVKSRAAQGGRLDYVEGWHVIAEANRIFGYDCWDRRTLPPEKLWVQRDGNQTSVFYATTVRITVRAGEAVIMREGIGTGFGRAQAPDVAYDMALKAAETDATKRALATFGNPFGLALYDKKQSGVTRARNGTSGSRAAPPPNRPALQSSSLYVVHTADGDSEHLSSPDAYVEKTLATIDTIGDLEELYAFWEANRSAFKRLKVSTPDAPALADRIVAALKSKARSLSPRPKAPIETAPAAPQGAAIVSPLAIPKEKRLRNKAHLDFVRQQPCLVCGREPSHAHHVRFAQQGAFGMKVSDEFTVPLCALHHDALHRVGNERSWWTGHGIDPLKAAEDLWRRTVGVGGDPSEPGSQSPRHVNGA